MKSDWLRVYQHNKFMWMCIVRYPFSDYQFPKNLRLRRDQRCVR